MGNDIDKKHVVMTEDHIKQTGTYTAEIIILS